MNTPDSDEVLGAEATDLSRKPSELNQTEQDVINAATTEKPLPPEGMLAGAPELSQPAITPGIKNPTLEEALAENRGLIDKQIQSQLIKGTPSPAEQIQTNSIVKTREDGTPRGGTEATLPNATAPEKSEREKLLEKYMKLKKEGPGMGSAWLDFAQNIGQAFTKYGAEKSAADMMAYGSKYKPNLKFKSGTAFKKAMTRFNAQKKEMREDIKALDKKGIVTKVIDTGDRKVLVDAKGNPLKSYKVSQKPLKKDINKPIKVGNKLVEKQPDGSFKEVFSAPLNEQKKHVSYQQTKYVTKDGTPVSYDPKSNQMYDLSTGKELSKDQVKGLKLSNTDQKNMVNSRQKLNVRMKDEDNVRKSIEKLSGITGARSNVAKIILGEKLARDGMRVIDQVESGEIVGTEQIAEELATVMASMLQGGNAATREAIHGLIPDTMRGDAYSIKQYIEAKPEPFLNKEFLNHFKHQMKNQSKFWRGELSQAEKAAYNSLKPVFDRKDNGNKINSDLYNNFMSAIDPASVWEPLTENKKIPQMSERQKRIAELRAKKGL